MNYSSQEMPGGHQKKKKDAVDKVLKIKRFEIFVQQTCIPHVSRANTGIVIYINYLFHLLLYEVALTQSVKYHQCFSSSPHWFFK